MSLFWFSADLKSLCCSQQLAPEKNYGDSPISDGQTKILTRKRMIVLEVLGDMVTVVPIMRWIKQAHPPGIEPYYVRNYFKVNDKRQVLNFDHGRIVHKTNLIQIPRADRKIAVLPLTTSFDELKPLLLKIHDKEEPPEVPEDRRMDENAKLEVGSIVQTLLESLVSVFILVFARLKVVVSFTARELRRFAQPKAPFRLSEKDIAGGNCSRSV